MIRWFKSGFSARRSRHGLWGVPLVIAVALVALLCVGTEQFATRENLFNLIAQAMPLLIAAIGQLFVILVGGLDLSVGSIISFSTAVLSLDGPAVVLIPAVFMLAAVVGLINGLVITRMGVHPIIATLAMQYVLLGITRILRPVSGGTVPDLVIAAVQGSVFGVPLPVFWGIIAVGLAAKILYGSRFGLHLFAIGGGVAAGMEDAASTYGIRVGRNIVLAYVASALFAALAGVFLAGRIVSLAGRFAEWNEEFERFEGSTAEMLRYCLDSWWERIGATPASGLHKLMVSEAGNFPVVREALGGGRQYGFKSGIDRAGGVLGVKSGGYFPGNDAKGITNHQSAVLLFDPDTGRPVAMVGGNLLTALRTAAAAALSVDLLARPDARVLGIVGAAHQLLNLVVADLCVHRRQTFHCELVIAGLPRERPRTGNGRESEPAADQRLGTFSLSSRGTERALPRP